MRKMALIVSLLISTLCVAQDWCAWSFKFKFRLDAAGPARYHFKNLEVLINDSYTFEMLRSSLLKLDSSTQEYTLELEYGCISCGWPRYDFPPDLYLKVNFDSSLLVTPFSTMIPVYFNKSDTYRDSTGFGRHRPATINLGIIPLKHFITDNYWKDRVEAYEIIEVKSAVSILFRKAGQYKPRRMNKLILALAGA